MSTETELKKLRWAHLPECDVLAAGWSAKRFTDVCAVIAGQSPPSETYNEKGQGLPFLQGNGDFSDRHPEPKSWCTAPAKVAEVNDTLISVRAPVGEVNRADRQYAIGRGLAAIRATSANPDFIYHGLQRWRWPLQRVAQGTTFDAVTARHFSQLLVALPDDTDEQAAIARVLDAVDAAIDQALIAIEKAKELRESLVAELLSKGVGREGVFRASSRDPKEFHSTPLGRLPRAWVLSDIRAEFELKNGITLNEAQRTQHPKWRYLRVANVQRDALSLDDVQELQAGEAEVMPRLLARNDILVVEGHADRMQIGRCALVTADAAGMTFQNHLFRLRSNGAILPEFACLWLNSTHAQRYWNAMCATSSGLNTINQRMLKRMRIPVPLLDEQKQIADITDASKMKIKTLGLKLSALQQLKKSLMHDLLTGTMRVDPKLFKELNAS